MTSSLIDFIETEYDAAIFIYCLTALADNYIRKEEIQEIHNEMGLLGLESFSDFQGYKISNWVLFINNLQKISGTISFKDIEANLESLAKKISSPSVRKTVLSAVLRIAYADDDFHSNEQYVVKELSKIWDL